MGEFEAIGDAVTGGLLARAVEPQAGEAAGRPYARKELPQLRRSTDRTLLRGLRSEGPRPSVGTRLLPGLPPEPVQFRREDLADIADARMAAGRDDPPLHRRRACPVHLAHRALSVHRFRDVRRAQFHGHARRQPREEFPERLKTDIAESQTKMAKLEADRGTALRPARISPSSTARSPSERPKSSRARR